jgi:hypothetical protein
MAPARQQDLTITDQTAASGRGGRKGPSLFMLKFGGRPNHPEPVALIRSLTHDLSSGVDDFAHFGGRIAQGYEVEILFDRAFRFQLDRG